jgi:prepilin-type N-terminal cleavage/methylation domain-containing protein
MAPARRNAARDERGFTLIEMLVALVCGLVVAGAAFAILEVSLEQSSRLSDVTQANQLGRATMTHMVDELHSACIAPKFRPIQPESTEKELIFINAYTPKAEITTAYKHIIVFNEEAKTLTDKTYQSNGGAWPSFTFPAVASPTSVTRFGEDIRPNGKTPVFQYYEYATKSATASNAPSSTLNEVNISTTALTAKQAESVGSVLISFDAGPTSGLTKNGRTVEMISQSTLSFSVPAVEATIVQGPCE